MSEVLRGDTRDGARKLAPVPIVDISGFFAGSPGERARIAGEVGRACETIGFVLIAGHGVPDDLIDDFYDIGRQFFQLPLDVKLSYKSPIDDVLSGYGCPGHGPGYHTSERQSFNVQRYDTLEELYLHGYPRDAAEVFKAAFWPQQPSQFRTIYRRYFEEMEGLAARLLRIFESALDLPDGWFGDKVDKDPSSLAMNYYSNDIDAGHEPSPYRFKAHVDGSVITVLHQDNGPGCLQLHQRGIGWGDVKAVPGTFVVNIGELMARWTNDRFVATPHRVLKPAEEETAPRMSAPFFLKPNVDATIAPIERLVWPGTPPKYPPVTGLDWLTGDAKQRYAMNDSTVRFAALAAADPLLR